MASSVGPIKFYSQYNGHPIDDLQTTADRMRGQRQRIVWLAGDSSLDNKHWLFQGQDKSSTALFDDATVYGDAIGIYKDVLSPPKMVKDVGYWMNSWLDQHSGDIGCINAAVEATTLRQRSENLLSQDYFIMKNLADDDVLVVSIGGNDVALSPSTETMQSIGPLLQGPSHSRYDQAVSHFKDLFQGQVETYIKRLTSNKMPAAVVVCMIYFPLEHATDSWCNGSLGRMSYDTSPALLQSAIRSMYDLATVDIQLPGTTVIPVPLFEVLDGKHRNDYHHRVEPSVCGGRTLAGFVCQQLETALPGYLSSERHHLANSAPCTAADVDADVELLDTDMSGSLTSPVNSRGGHLSAVISF